MLFCFLFFIRKCFLLSEQEKLLKHKVITLVWKKGQNMCWMMIDFAIYSWQTYFSISFPRFLGYLLNFLRKHFFVLSPQFSTSGIKIACILFLWKLIEVLYILISYFWQVSVIHITPYHLILHSNILYFTLDCFYLRQFDLITVDRSFTFILFIVMWINICKHGLKKFHYF